MGSWISEWAARIVNEQLGVKVTSTSLSLISRTHVGSKEEKRKKL